MGEVTLDIETDSLTPSVIHCVVIEHHDTNCITSYTIDEKEELEHALLAATHVIGHNIIDFDLPVLDSLWGIKVSNEKVIDTLILSHLLNYNLDGGHSLESWGERLSFPKLEFKEFKTYTPEMLEYCINDVKLNTKLYHFLMKKLKPEHFKDAIKVEHEIAFICRGMNEDGFKFDRTKAQELWNELRLKLIDLDKELQGAFPPKSKLVREVTPKLTKFGTISKTNMRWYDGQDYTIFSPDSPFSLFEYEAFNPNSPRQIVERLNEAGWKPTEKTKGHLKNKDKGKKDHYQTYGWKVNEVNLSTLPTYEGVMEFKETCRVNLQKLDENTRKNITKETKKEKEKQQEIIITATLNDLEITTAKEIMELVSKTLIGWELSKDIAAKFVEETKSSWLITVTPTDMYVDCSAACAMDSWVGLRLTKKQQEGISNETNLSTLPDDAPPATRKLVERLLLDSRRSTLEEWFTAYDSRDEAIHGTFRSIGTWTHRMSHQRPNMGNVAAPKSIKYSGEKLRELATSLGKRMRQLWIPSPGNVLIGTDAEGIQLRLFAHFINDPAFIKAVVEGKKEDGTDPHSLNQRIIGPLCHSRDTAKTFIYAFLLGAGIGKVAEIFNCSKSDAERIKNRFTEAYPGLRRLKEEVIPSDAERGYFVGLDGRLVACDSEHLMLAGYLQNGEQCVMKHANVKWRQDADELRYHWTQCNFVHDEFQTDCHPDVAEQVAKYQRDSIVWAGKHLNVLCPLAGASNIGNNWYETH